MSLKVEILSRQKNKIQASVSVNVFGTHDVRGEIVIGNIGVNLKSWAMSEDCFYVLVMLENRENKNNGDDIYSCRLNSEKLEIKNQRFTCDDSEWRLIHTHHEFEPNFNFDLTVEVDMVELKSPLAVLHYDIDLTDFELKGTDGSVKFHSAVLAAASPVLRQMLKGQWAETESRCLQLQDTSQETLQHFKDYLYLNVLPSEGVEQLLLLASYYLMTDLERKCVRKLLMEVTAESSSELMKFALNHKIMDLYYGFLRLVQSGVIVIDEVMHE